MGRFGPHWVERLERRVLLAGTGLSGAYYDTADLTTLKTTRTDATVDFNWAAGAPASGVGADTFSVRWSGQVEAAYSEEYAFHFTSDDGARLWVDGKLIAGDWVSRGSRAISGRIALRAGQRYDIKIEYFDNTGNASAKLEWESASQARQVVPAARLYPTSSPDDRGSMQSETWAGVSGATIASLTGNATYPAQPTSREYLLKFESLQRDWANNYGTRMRGYLYVPVSGSYTLAISGDDVAELYLSTDATAGNKALIATASLTAYDDFMAQAGQRSGAIALVAGTKYYIEVLHKESSGADHVEVGWKRPGESAFTIIDGQYLSPLGTETALPAQGSILATLAQGRPRLLSTPQRFEWAKQQVAAGGQVATWFNSIKSSATGYLDDALPLYNPDVRGTILSVSRSVVDHIYKLALVYRITGEAQYAERAWAELEAAAAFPDWHPAHFLDTAEMTHGFGIAYDWLYDYWTPQRRTTLRTAIVEKGLNQALPLYRANSSWVSSGSNNWNLVCNGGMIVGALAIAEDQPTLVEEILAKAIPSAKAVLRHFTADAGAWYEGPGYWGYTTEYEIPLVAGLETALGSDFAIGQTTDLDKAGTFALYNVGPTNLSFNFADGGAGGMGGSKLFYYARRYNQPELAWHVRNTNSAQVLGVLWYDGRGGELGALAAGPDAQWRGDPTAYATQDVVNLRQRWGDSEASFAGFKAGKVGDSHGNLDAGSFVFDAQGTRWAHDLGGDNYALPNYFGSARWTYYRMRAEGQNTLVINPTSAAEQVVGSLPKMVKYESTAHRSFSVADLTAAYSGSTRVWRGLSLDKNDGSLLVQDEIQMPGKSEVYWFMHVKLDAANIQISADGMSAILTSGSDRLYVRIVTGGGKLEVMEPAPLASSPNPDGQNANVGYKKLAIHLTNVVNRTLAVWLVPLKPGQNVPAMPPTITALEGWNLPTQTRIWRGDVDEYEAGGAPAVDATWLSSITGATGLGSSVLDELTDNRVAPITFDFAVPAGWIVSSARLEMSLRSTGGDISNDVLYLDSSSASLSYGQLGWSVLSSRAARTLDLGSYLGALQDGRLNIAVSNNTAIDWASLTVEFSPAGLSTSTTLTAEADAYVRDGTYAAQNFGTGNLSVKFDGTNYNREAFLRFNVSAITAPVTAAYLLLTPIDALVSPENYVALVSDDSWTETGINWNNRPASTGTVASWNTVKNVPVWVDVTALVQDAATGDKKISLKIAGTGTGADYWSTYASREDGDAARRPQLVVMTLDGAPGAAMNVSVADADDTIRVVRDGAFLNVFVNNTTPWPNQRRDLMTLDSLAVNSGVGADVISLELGLPPALAGGISVDAGAGTDTLGIVGTSGADAVVVSTGSILLNGVAIAVAGHELSSFDLATGADLLTINAAAVKLAGDGAISSAADVTIDGAGILDLNGSANTIDAFTLISGSLVSGTMTASAYTLYSGTISASLAGTVGLTKKGTGTVVLSGANSFAGNVRVEQGVLNLQHGLALGAPGAGLTISVDASANRLATVELDGPDFVLDNEPLGSSGAGFSNNGVIRNLRGNHTWNGDITLTGGGGGSNFQSDAGLLTFNGNVTTNMTSRSLTLQGAGDGRINGIISNGLTVALPVTKNGAGTWTLGGANTYGGATTVNTGTLVFDATQRLGGQLKVNAGATARVGPGTTKLLIVPSISIDSARGAKLDLTNAALAIDYTGTSVFTATRTLIVTGRNGGAWTGAGISSSIAAADTAQSTGVGYGEAAVVLNMASGDMGSWLGQSIDGTTVLLRGTMLGDSNLDGAVNFDDLVTVAQNYEILTGMLWTTGDFTFDSKTQFADLVYVSQNYERLWS